MPQQISNGGASFLSCCAGVGLVPRPARQPEDRWRHWRTYGAQEGGWLLACVMGLCVRRLAAAPLAVCLALLMTLLHFGQASNARHVAANRPAGQRAGEGAARVCLRHLQECAQRALLHALR